MEAHESDEYVTFSLSGVHNAVQEHIISEEICEQVDECVLQDGLTEVPVTEVNTEVVESHVAVEILQEQSDDEDEDNTVYPIYIKQEEQQQQYTSGDDESMAVEALRQLGGMYPSFENKKVSCPTCGNFSNQTELTKHHAVCNGTSKFSCTTCGEKFERKIDLNNHIVCHQVDRPHACRTCGNLFRSKNDLQSHMAQVHQIEQSHKCIICGAEFQRPSSLSNHMKIHTYVAGRALTQSKGNNASQSVETFKKWYSSSSTTESQSTSVPSSSVQSVQNYENCQVQWAVSPYNFQNDQSVGSLSNQEDKLDALQEFGVMSNGEVAQFEYTQQNSMSNQINQQYSLSLNTFNNSDGVTKSNNASYNNESRRNYTESESDDAKQHTCSHCGMAFSRAIALISHEKIHASKNWNMPMECEYCDKQFQDGAHLAAHQTTCTKKIMQNNIEQGISNKWGKHACSECGKKFTTKQKMFRHQWIHRKKTHSCEVCGIQFEKQNQLDKHRLSAHPGDSPFTCAECGKSFVSRQGLWEHGRTHAGSPAHFHCNTCSKTFSSRQGYLIHHRTHTGERPYGCKFCWKAFRDGGTLRKHERIHTGERPHVCPLCSRAFNQKVVLREHVRWVHAAGKNETETTGPPYPCPLCGTLNQDRDELCAHIVKHSDQMIAEAKAKTNNNTPKAKPTRKKTKSSNSNTAQHKELDDHDISRLEQSKALMSISKSTDKSSDQQLLNDKQNNTFVVVTEEKQSENFINLSQLKHDNIRLILNEKQSHSVNSSQNNQGEANYLITMDKQEEATHILHTHEHGNNTIHLIQSVKSNDTLNLISKQNESLSVLTVNNSEEHENFSSQIAQISNTDVPMNMVTHRSSTTQGRIKVHNSSNRQEESLIQDGIPQTAVIQIVQYQQDSDDGEELICGICGEDFTDKNILMEHVKIHI